MERWIEEGKPMVSYTSEELTAMQARGEDKTDWDKIGTMSEEQLQTLIAADPDDFDATDKDFARAYRPNLGENPPTEEEVAQRLAAMRSPKEERRVFVNVTLPPHLAQWLQEQPNRQDTLIEQALTAFFKIKTPA